MSKVSLRRRRRNRKGRRLRLFETLEERTVLSGSDPISFALRSTYATANPNDSATGDFNGDGIPDLVAANDVVNTVSVFFGNGDGTFASPSLDLTVGSAPTNVLAVDVNNDGTADIVTSDSASNGVSVLLGDGNGNFAPRAAYTAGLWSNSVAAGHFSADGHLDLVTTNYDAGTISVLKGDGSGAFQEVLEFAVSPRVSAVTVADMNGDGLDDLLASESLNDYVQILLRTGNDSNGNATFAAPATYTTGDNPFRLSVADFDEDGTLDVVSMDILGDRVSYFRGLGGGTLAPAVANPLAGGPYDVQAEDLNGDGILDLAVVTIFSNETKFLLGNGDGTFNISPLSLPTDALPTSLSLGDYDGSGTVDAATVAYNGDTLKVWLNQDTPTDPHFTLNAPADAVAGIPFDVTVTALDAAGNVKTDFTGTIQFRSSDALATLPADYTFTAGDNGVKTFSVMLSSAGEHTLTAAWADDTTIFGSRVVATSVPVPPPSNLVGWWSGDGSAGDVKGVNHATLAGGTSFDTGIVGQAFRFDGADDYVDVGGYTDDVQAFEFWFNPDVTIDSSSPWQGIAAYHQAGGAHEGIGLGSGTSVVSGEVITLMQATSSTSYARTAVTGITLLADEWYHLAVNWNTTLGRYDIYLNGVTQLVTSGSAAHVPLFTRADMLRIGEFLGGAFAGRFGKCGQHCGRFALHAFSGRRDRPG